MPNNNPDPMGGGMPPMGGGDPMMGGGADPMGGDPNGGMPPMDGADPMGGAPETDPMGGQDDGSGYDTNFDAGVEADEDEDPEKYIQQLTGKLSTELNKANGEGEIDTTQLNKYVAKMIVKAAAKHMDEKDKKDLIKTINSTKDEDTMPDEEGGEEQMPDDDGMGAPEGQENGDEQMPMNENYFVKKDLKRLIESLGDVNGMNGKNTTSKKPTLNREKKGYNKNTPFSPKGFTNKMTSFRGKR